MTGRGNRNSKEAKPTAEVTVVADLAEQAGNYEDFKKLSGEAGYDILYPNQRVANLAEIKTRAKRNHQKFLDKNSGGLEMRAFCPCGMSSMPASQDPLLNMCSLVRTYQKDIAATERTEEAN